MSFEKITSILNEEFPDIIVSQNEDDFPKSITIRPDSIREIMQFFRDDERLFFDQLSCLSGVDNGPEEDNMEVVYNLYSIPFNYQLMVKVILKRNKPLIPTVSDIWKTADWHEREAYDLLGIVFTEHPDLRRILLPTDWEGHPLRKDYQLQKYYHGIKVEY